MGGNTYSLAHGNTYVIAASPRSNGFMPQSSLWLPTFQGWCVMVYGVEQSVRRMVPAERSQLWDLWGYCMVRRLVFGCCGARKGAKAYVLVDDAVALRHFEYYRKRREEDSY